MKIVAISDTHSRHRELKLPSGDMLIHAGDLTTNGSRELVIDFLDWFSELNFEYKIFIAGNHDFFFERKSKKEVESVIPTTSVIYLNDSGVSVNGVNIWGSPVQPKFYNWAFNRKRGYEIDRHWQLIPYKTDILITHGPPYGYLDENNYMERVGCVDLLKRVDVIKPKYHVFGHIHSGYGIKSNDNGTKFINASILDDSYKISNEPVIFKI